MGTFYTPGATRQDIINEILEPIKKDDSLLVSHVAREDGEYVLWTVEKRIHNDETFQYIGCYLLRNDCGDWGYKPLDEAMGPAYYSVPKTWLDKYPCILLHKGFSEKWRKKVLTT